MNIGGFLKFSLIDYPGKISAVVFTQGCNFYCPYCHNPELVPITNRSKTCLHELSSALPTDSLSEPTGKISEQEILDFLSKRKNRIEGVVITGGEPTIQKDLIDFIKKIKLMRFKIKLDTNGSNPDILKNLINNKLIDYVAMDVKCPFEKLNKFLKYQSIIKDSDGIPKQVRDDNYVLEKIHNNIIKSISLIKNSKISYEFRTTVVKSDLSSNDLIKIAKMIEGANLWVLQKFKKSKHLNPDYKKAESFNNQEFSKIASQLKKYVKKVKIR